MSVAQLTARGDSVLARDGHYPIMHLSHHLRSQLTPQPAHSFCRPEPYPPNSGELAVHQVGAHFPAQIFVAPVADVLQQHHAQYDFGGGGPAAAGLALLAAFRQLLLNDEQQGLVLQGLIGAAHPRFP